MWQAFIGGVWSGAGKMGQKIWIPYVVPVSSEKVTAHLAASSSRISTVGGFLIFSDRASFTSRLESRMTTHIPASSDSPNIAPSKSTFHTSAAGGHHLRGTM